MKHNDVPYWHPERPGNFLGSVRTLSGFDFINPLLSEEGVVVLIGKTKSGKVEVKRLELGDILCLLPFDEHPLGWSKHQLQSDEVGLSTFDHFQLFVDTKEHLVGSGEHCLLGYRSGNIEQNSLYTGVLLVPNKTQKQESIAKILANRLGLRIGDCSQKQKQQLLEYAAWIPMLYEWACPLDLGINRSIEALGLDFYHRLSIGNQLENSAIPKDEYKKYKPWTPAQTRRAINVFESQGWLTQERPPIQPEGIGKRNLGTRVRLLPDFYADFYQADKELVEAYIQSLLPEDRALACQSYFNDRADLIRLRQRLEKQRAVHRDALGHFVSSSTSVDYHRTVLDHLNKLLGSNQGGRRTQPIIKKRYSVSENSDRRRRDTDQGFSFKLNTHFGRVRCPRSLDDSCFNQAMIETEELLQVPREMVIQTMLTALSVSCQRWLKVSDPINHADSPVNLYLLTVAESGSRKTTLENYFLKTIMEKNLELLDSAEVEEDHYQAEKEIWEEESKALTRLFNKATVEEKEAARQTLFEHKMLKPKPMPPANFCFKDVTESALLDGLQNRWKMGALLSSEADDILNGYLLQRSAALNDLWSGSNVDIKRVSKKTSGLLKGVKFTLSLQTQPVSFERFILKRGDVLRGNGFLARMLTVVPNINFGQRKVLPPSELKYSPKKDEFIKRIDGFMARSLVESPKEKNLSFNSEAQALWLQYGQRIEVLQGEGESLSCMTGFASKIIEQASRLAALIHISHSDENEIGADCVTYAMRLMQGYAGVYREYIAPTPRLVLQAEKAYQKLVDTYGRQADDDALEYTRVIRKTLYDSGIFRGKNDAGNITQLLCNWGVIRERDQDLVFDPDGGRGSLKQAYYRMMYRDDRRF